MVSRLRRNPLAAVNDTNAKHFSAMTRAFFPGCAALMSPRTAKYVEAFTQEGDNFNFAEWLERVRDEEAKRVPPTITLRDVAAVRADNPINASNSWDARPCLGPAVIGKLALNLRAFRRQHRQAKSKTPKARLRRWFEKIHRAWGVSQASRRRDAIYIFLEKVFTVVEHYKLRRRTRRLVRHAFRFADLPFSKHVDAFTAVIRSTSDDNLDSKTISKWARALRYVARCKKPDVDLTEFMKEAGGVNGCAARYAQRKGLTC